MQHSNAIAIDELSAVRNARCLVTSLGRLIWATSPRCRRRSNFIADCFALIR